jgi:hypothetical protein
MEDVAKNLTSTIQSSVQITVDALQKEIQEWRSKAFHYEYELSDSQRKNNDIQQLVVKQEKEIERLRHNIYYYKDALRFQQAAKRHKGKTRNLPTFHSVSRARAFENLNAERVFLRHWREENRNEKVLNHILSDDWDRGTDVSQRDAIVAATVIQWLGTNCGRYFLEECEADVKKVREKYLAAEKSRLKNK